MKLAGRIAVLGTCLLPFLSCTTAQERRTSDHFDGEKFFNPTLAGQFSPSFANVFDLIRESRAPWPEAVETAGVPRLNEALDEGEVALTFINHATFLIQFPGLNVLTDPVWSTRASPVGWVGPKRVRAPGVKLEQLPRIDLIIISHNHYDHLDIETLKLLNERFAPRVIVPIGDRSLVESIGVKDVREVDWWDAVTIGDDTRITFAPTQHSSARSLFDRDRSLWGSYSIRYREWNVYFGGDAGYSSHYREIARRLGPPDIALLGIGSYEPRWFMKALHMNPAEAVVAHQDLGAKLSIGMHYGTFQMSSEAFDAPQRDLIRALEERGLPQESFITLDEGETRIWGSKQRDEMSKTPGAAGPIHLIGR